MRTTLESGAWIEHRPIEDLKARDRDAVTLEVRKAIPLTGDGEVDRSNNVLTAARMDIAARNACIAQVVTGWSYDLPVPRYEASEVHDAGSIGELPLDDITGIEELIAPYTAKLRRRPDPKGTTTTASSGSSRDAAGSSPKD